nr:MAG TPA: hypothetical protein [Caudoviricetes sp.]
MMFVSPEQVYPSGRIFVKQKTGYIEIYRRGCGE